MQVFASLRNIYLHRADIMHLLLSGTYAESYLTFLFAHAMGIPLVCTIHDPRLHLGDVVGIHSLWLHIRTIELCSQLIVHGQSIAHDIVNLLGIDPAVVNVIPHGNYDIYLNGKRPPEQEKREMKRVLLFGRMKLYKGLDILIEAASLVRQRIPNVKIVLAGSGEELDKHARQIASDSLYEIHNRKLNDDEIASLFTDCDCVVLPYREASQSGPLHLAYSFGRPVVATSVGAIPESLTHNATGFLVPPENPAALAAALISVLSDDDLARRLGRAGRVKADTELEWSGEISRRTCEVYDKAIHAKRHNARSISSIGPQERWKRVKDYYDRHCCNG